MFSPASPKIFKPLAIIPILSLAFIAQLAFGTPDAPVVRIALLDAAVQDKHLENFINQTIEGIKSDLKDYQVEVIPYTQKSLLEALKKKEVDYTISDSFFYLSESASARSRGLSRVASVLSMTPNGPSGYIGGVVIGKKQANFTDLASLKGKSIAFPSAKDYYGWRALQREISDAGYDPNAFFSRLLSTNSSLDETVIAVLNGDADLGIVHTCYLENRQNDPKLEEIEILGKKDYPKFPCQSSTHLYLGWVLAATPQSNPETTREIVKAILSVNDPEGSKWAFGADFTENHSMFDELDIAQYSEFHRFALIRFIRKNLPWFMLAFGLLVGLLLHTVRTNHLVEIRTRDLKNAQKERTTLMDKLSNMQKVGVIGLMSSLLAHELKQPIGALRNYLQGLKFQLQRGNLTRESLEEAVREMESQIVRANSIVEKVRGYAKDKKSQKSTINLTDVVNQSLETVRKTIDHLPKITFKEPKTPILVEGDRTEIELAFYNILKNGIDACRSVKNSEIQIFIIPEGATVKIDVIDNGPTLSDEEFNSLGTPLKTTKSDGLGLGFPIANRIAEAHGGRLGFSRLPDGRLSVSIHLPMKKNVEQDQSVKAEAAT